MSAIAKGLLHLLLPALIGNIAFCQIAQPKTPQYQSLQPTNSTILNTSTNTLQYQQPGNTIGIAANATDITHQISNNTYRINATYADKQKEVEGLIKEYHVNPHKHISDKQYAKDSLTNAIAIKGFFPALRHLQDMLEGKSKLSVADAYYTIESAYGNPYPNSQTI